MSNDHNSTEKISILQEKALNVSLRDTSFFEQYEWLKKLTEPMNKANEIFSKSRVFPKYDYLSRLNSVALNFNVMPQVNCDAVSKTNNTAWNSLTESLTMVSNSCNSIIQQTVLEKIDFLKKLCYSPLDELFEKLQISRDASERYKEKYMQIMYETKWFPYASWIADISLLYEFNNIVASSRGASKNREKRIDKAIISYYTDVKIRAIKKTWWKSELDYCIRKAICQSINAYLRGEYALTISCLSTVWEGLIYMKAKDVTTLERKRQRMQETKQELKELVEHNDYKLIFSDYFDNFIVSNCNEVNDVMEGVPNRHGVAHSWYKKYPNKKAALNAILITDFIIDLQPIEQTED